VLPAVQATPLPGNISFEAGACLGIPAMTAIHAIVLANPTKDTTLLVAGGGGAVSQYAIQFAKAKGARSSPRCPRLRKPRWLRRRARDTQSTTGGRMSLIGSWRLLASAASTQ